MASKGKSRRQKSPFFMKEANSDGHKCPFGDLRGGWVASLLDVDGLFCRRDFPLLAIEVPIRSDQKEARR